MHSTNWFQWMHPGLPSINWRNTLNCEEIVQPWRLTPIYSVLQFYRKACLYSWYSRSTNLLPPTPHTHPSPPHSGLCHNSSGQSDLQAIYEIWITPRWGKKCPEIFCCVCDKRGGWETDDCLWDGKRNEKPLPVQYVRSSAHTHTHPLKHR